MSVILVTTEEVCARLNLPEDDALVALVEASLPSATAYLETSLRTSFEEGTSEDVFYVDSDTPSYGHCFYFLLRNGFISDVTVSISDVDGTSSESILPVALVEDKGIVVISDTYIDGSEKYVTVNYSYGLTDENVPSWLKEAAYSYIVQLISLQQVTDKGSPLNNIMKFVKAHGTQLLDMHLRRHSYAIKSLA